MRESKKKKIIHFLMCIVGGWFGGYSILLLGSMANAVTNNLALMVLELLQLHITNWLLRLGVVIAYILGSALPVWVEHRTSWSPRRVCLFLEIVFIGITPWLPESLPLSVRSYPIFFMCAMQYNSFLGYDDVAAATVFSTNNTRQATRRLLTYALTGDEVQKRTGLGFLCCLIFFCIGVGASLFASWWMGLYSLYLLYVIILIVLKMEPKSWKK